MVEFKFSKLAVAGSSPVLCSKLERCPSGLRSSIGNAVYLNGYPGFESLSLREKEEWPSGLRHTLAKRARGKPLRRFKSFFLRDWGIVQWQDKGL